MKRLLFGLGVLASINAHAISQSDLSLSEKCKAEIEKKVTAKYGANDETFSVIGTKLRYGGTIGGFSAKVVALVKTSDEVEPRDILAIASPGDQGSCKVERISVLADGSTVDFPEFQ